jgi:hypothetical protein
MTFCGKFYENIPISASGRKSKRHKLRAKPKETCRAPNPKQRPASELEILSRHFLYPVPSLHHVGELIPVPVHRLEARQGIAVGRTGHKTAEVGAGTGKPILPHCPDRLLRVMKLLAIRISKTGDGLARHCFQLLFAAADLMLLLVCRQRCKHGVSQRMRASGGKV